jgi:hypothetical protein
MIRCSAFSGARWLFVGSPSGSIFLFEHDLSKAGIHFSVTSGCRFPPPRRKAPGTPVLSVQAERYATGTPLNALKLKPSPAAWPESVRQWHCELLLDGRLFALNTRPLKATPRQGDLWWGTLRLPKSKSPLGRQGTYTDNPTTSIDRALHPIGDAIECVFAS